MIEELRAEMEQEILWRQKEIQHLENSLHGNDNDEQYDFNRRPIVVMLYAHLEGFCHFSLQYYVDFINKQKLICSEVDYSIAALSLSREFSTFRNSDKTSRIFEKELPRDTKLRNFSRDVEFIEKTDQIFSQPAKIPDGVVDLESNVKPVILKKNLYQLSMPYENLDLHYANINKLLRYRCDIAHGSRKNGIEYNEYIDLKESTYRIIEFLRDEVLDSIESQRYLRSQGQETA